MEAQNTKSASHGKLPLFLILAAGAAGIFLAPWYVPVAQPSISLSYAYGFNNSVAILATGLTLAALFILHLCRRRGALGDGTDRAIIDTLGGRNGSAGDRGFVLSVFCAAVLSCSLLAAWYAYEPFDSCGEMSYFLTRVCLLILHRAPYYDFSFIYGPAMIYIPFRLYQAAHGILSVEQAYFAVLLFHWVCGLCLLAWCVRLISPPARRVAIFWLFAAILFNPTLGLNYAPLRFVLPVVAVVLSHFAVLNAARSGARGHLPVALAAFLGPLLNFEFSPEMGMAVTIALVVYFAALLRTPQRPFAYGLVLALLGALAAVAPWSTAYLRILFTFGGGGSIPVLPGLAMLLFLAGVFALLPRLAVLGIASREAVGPASLAMCVLTGLLILPALSRCDPGHVFLNGLGVFLVGIAVLAHLPDQRWFKRAATALILVFAFLSNWLFLFHYGYFFRTAVSDRAWMRSHPMPASQPPGSGFYFSKRFPPIDGLDPLLAYGGIATPLDWPEDIGRFLMLHGRFQVGYYPGLVPGDYAVNQTLDREQEIDSFKTILVRKSALSPPPSAAEQVAADRRFLELEALLPVRIVPRHAFYNSDRLVADRISRDFSVIGEFREYYIMARRPGGKG